MISSPNLRIDAAENSFACYGRSSNEVPRPILIFVAAKGDGFAYSGRRGNEVPRPILIYIAAKGDGFAYCDRLRLRCSASDSNLRCCKGGWFRLLRSFAAST